MPRHFAPHPVAALCLLIAAWLLITLRLHAAPPVARIDQVKAAFVLNIARFTIWPEQALDASAPLGICALHDNPLQAALQLLTDQTIGHYTVRVYALSSFTDLQTCQILLIAHHELKPFQDSVAAHFPTGVLTILDGTDTLPPAHARQAIFVTLIRKGERLGFEIDLEQTRQAGLRLGSELLKLATLVSRGGE